VQKIVGSGYRIVTIIADEESTIFIFIVQDDPWILETDFCRFDWALLSPGTVVRILEDYEAPWITLKRTEEDVRVVIRKTVSLVCLSIQNHSIVY
jgi:hypothetical protein